MTAYNETTPILGNETPEEPIVGTGNMKGRQGKRGVNALQLTMMIYFFTSGGPFGIESAVGAGGPLLTLIALVVIPTLWSLPQALMAAELSLMISENGGNVVWVHRAFGGFIGWINAFNNIAQGICSLSLLAVLFVNYIHYSFNQWERWLIQSAFIILNTVLNILGLRTISRLSVVFLVFVLSPFVAEAIIVGLRHDYDFKILGYIPPMKDVQWNIFLSTVIWSYGGFDSMGSLAGEVKGGRKTFLSGIVGSFPLIFLNYFFPICIGYSVAQDWTQWQSGYFSQIAQDLHTTKNYLYPWMVAASGLSNFGQFNAAMAPMSRVIWAMANTGYLPSFIGWSWQRHTGTIRPIAAVVFTGTACIATCAIPYNILVQVFLAIRIVNLICEYGALIRLRYIEPDTPRPFVVPGGKFGVWVLGIPTVALATFCLVYADWMVWAAAGSVNALVFLSYGIKLLVERSVKNKQQHKGGIN